MLDSSTMRWLQDSDPSIRWLEYERSAKDETVRAARLRGQEYLLERRLFRRKSTGEVIERDRKSGTVWTRFTFPTWWQSVGLVCTRKSHAETQVASNYLISRQ
jgi:hypothetical protein